MGKNNENKEGEKLIDNSKDGRRLDTTRIVADEEADAVEPKFRRWEADEMRAAMFEEEEKRPWLSTGGLLLGLLCWIALFALPKPGFESLDKQLYVMMAITLGAFLMSFFGRKRAFGMSVIGMLVSGGLMLFLIIALIVLLVTK